MPPKEKGTLITTARIEDVLENILLPLGGALLVFALLDKLL